MNIQYLVPKVTHDEQAIASTLMELGNSVKIRNSVQNCDKKNPILFHNILHPELLQYLEAPKILWYFDKVEIQEMPNRRQHLQNMMRYSDFHYFTDGDWVDLIDKPNCKVLRQGAYQLVEPRKGVKKEYDVLAAFWAYGKRMEFLKVLKDYCRRKDLSLKEIPPTERVYGEEYARVIQESKVVVSPPYPTTNRYWSNRVYQVLGFGGTLLHPFSSGLVEEFRNYRHLVFYDPNDIDSFFSELDYWTQSIPSKTLDYGFEKVKNSYTYKHRVQQLTTSVQEQLGAITDG